MVTRTNILFLVLLLISGCVQNKYVPIERNSNSEIPYKVSVGDTVRVITDEAESLEFKLTGVTSDSFIGDGIEIPFQNIQMLQVREIDSDKTAWATGGGSLLLVYVVGIIAFVALAP